MNIIKPIIAGIFCLLVIKTHGQVNDARIPEPTVTSYEIKKKNIIYLEAFGNAVSYSVNYERIFFNKNKIAMSIRAGYSYTPLFNFSDGIFGSVNQVPVELNFIYTQKNIFEKLGLREDIGIGATFQRSVDNTDPDFPETNRYCFGFLRIGVRYQRSNSGWFYRIAFTPNIFVIDDDGDPNGIFYFFPYGGISIGRNF